MNIVKSYARILYIDGYRPIAPSTGVLAIDIGVLDKIEAIGRVSHRSEDRQTGESWKRFIETVVLQHGDWSITEHASVTVEALVDRGITHEWVRHRIGAYTQESTRFVNYEKKMPPSFIMPDLPKDDEIEWKITIEALEERYKNLVRHGVTPQIARSVFPNALASKLIVTYNLRNWRHFFIMRTTKEAHPQMKEVTIPLLEEFKSTIPLLYDDIMPNARQADNLRLPR